MIDAEKIARAREEYEGTPFDIADLSPTWHEQFGKWFKSAADAGMPEPNAMVVATADASGAPSVRTVLMRGVDERGLVFYTNFGSAKGRDLAVNMHAAAVFSWVAIHRQIVIRGAAAIVSAEESDAYWASRPRDSRISAIASPQSEVVPSRDALEQVWRDLAADQHADLSRPAQWGGFRIAPSSVEFWQGRPHRFHDRLRYRLDGSGSRWVIERLAP
jgi:pyridoxamine 5'-phosphate oxidase